VKERIVVCPPALSGKAVRSNSRDEDLFHLRVLVENVDDLQPASALTLSDTTLTTVVVVVLTYAWGVAITTAKTYITDITRLSPHTRVGALISTS
jgi:hypothetical protein